MTKKLLYIDKRMDIRMYSNASCMIRKEGLQLTEMQYSRLVKSNGGYPITINDCEIQQVKDECERSI
jgi:hypothetical protein